MLCGYHFTEGSRTLFLVFQQVGTQFVLTCSQNNPSGLVVGCDDNQRFVRMLFIELVCHFDGIVHVYNLFKSCCRIVAMASPVDFSAFHHQKETVRILLAEEMDGCPSNIL